MNGFQSNRPDVALSLIRGLMILLGGVAGYGVAQLIFAPENINRIYITILGALLTSLFVGRSSSWLRDTFLNLSDAIRHTPPKVIVAVTVATIAALLISVLLNNALTNVPGFGWYFQLGITLVLESILVAIGLANQEMFALVSNRAPVPERSTGAVTTTLKLLDTSVIIDGRVLEVAQTGFLDGPFVVPSFVLRELQYFADQSDTAKRAKGRRGLELLEKMRGMPGLAFQVREVADDVGTKDTMAVDDRLVRAALELNALLVTNDNGLAKVAGLQGVRTLSVNVLAEALKPKHGAGDEITITVVKEGSQPGQGIAYLEDGTMVVIEDGVALRGRTVRVAVVSNIQTALGRMIFAKPKELM